MLFSLGADVGDIDAAGIALIMTPFMPAIWAEAGLVPCADSGIRQMLRRPSPREAW